MSLTFWTESVCNQACEKYLKSTKTVNCELPFNEEQGINNSFADLMISHNIDIVVLTDLALPLYLC